MNVAAGKLRHRLEIQKPTQVIDTDTGADTYTFSTITKRWGSIEQLTGEEDYAGAQVAAGATHKITIRYCPELLSDYRIRFGKREFNIKGIWIPDEIKDFQIVFVSE